MSFMCQCSADDDLLLSKTRRYGTEKHHAETLNQMYGCFACGDILPELARFSSICTNLSVRLQWRYELIKKNCGLRSGWRTALLESLPSERPPITAPSTLNNNQGGRG